MASFQPEAFWWEHGTVAIRYLIEVDVFGGTVIVSSILSKFLIICFLFLTLQIFF